MTRSDCNDLWYGSEVDMDPYTANGWEINMYTIMFVSKMCQNR